MTHLRSATAVAPANIAFIKYWGMQDVARTLPYNGSISMNLDACLTTTTVTFDPDLAEEWNRFNLLRGHTVRIALGPRFLEGKVRAIDAEGALCVDDGLLIHRLFGGQVLREPLTSANGNS